MELSAGYQRQNTSHKKTTMTLLERIQAELDYRTDYPYNRKRILFDEYAVEYHELSESMTDEQIVEFVNELMSDI